MDTLLCRSLDMFVLLPGSSLAFSASLREYAFEDAMLLRVGNWSERLKRWVSRKDAKDDGERDLSVCLSDWPGGLQAGLDED